MSKSASRSEPEELSGLRELIRSQTEEIERLRRQLAEESDRVSRRGLVKGLGLGSLVALGAAGGALSGLGGASAAPDGVVENSDLAGALPAQLMLKANGVDIPGDSTAVGREGAIEVLYYDQKVAVPTPGGSGQASGRRQYEPIVFRKRIDKSTPLIAQALAHNEVIEANFSFFRPSPSGDGTTQHFFTVEISQGRVASVQQYLPEVFQTGSEMRVQMLEQVGFVFNKITWTFVDGGITFTDSFQAN